MKVHIVGAGPTGMSLAWEIEKTGQHEIIIYDKKSSAGGSWWEPEIEVRDLHAHRMVFDKAFINTRSLFKEMGIKWNDIFQKVNNREVLETAVESLSIKDYITLVSLFSRVLMQPSKYKQISLKKAIGSLSVKGHKYIEHLPLIMDGVPWDVMSAYEFVKNIDHTSLSSMFTQKLSGKVMCDAMEKRLKQKGVCFEFNKELSQIKYFEDEYKAKFKDSINIEDGMMFLCVDNEPAQKLIGDNWGNEALKKLKHSTYGAINILLDYDEKIVLKTDIEIASSTKWKLQPKVLFGTNTVSCVICDLKEEVIRCNPIKLKKEVLRQLKLPEPRKARIGWGAEWNGERWTFSQSSGVLSLNGQLPFFGKCSKVAMCGMMSPRNTPYSSIEASVEVSRSLSRKVFGTRKPFKPLLVSHLLMYIIIVLLIITNYEHILSFFKAD